MILTDATFNTITDVRCMLVDWLRAAFGLPSLHKDDPGVDAWEPRAR